MNRLQLDCPEQTLPGYSNILVTQTSYTTLFLTAPNGETAYVDFTDYSSTQEAIMECHIFARRNGGLVER